MRLHTTNIAKLFICKNLKKGSTAIDATMGRGNDTLTLCKLVGKKGKVLAFDIQSEALESTKKLLLDHKTYEVATLILDGHENMHKYANEESIDCITFNFGYLPKGDHSICTKPKTSILAVQQALKLLKVGGVISLCIYHGGDTGFDEKNSLLSYIKTIDCHKYTVFMGDFINRPNNPPIFVGIVRDR